MIMFVLLKSVLFIQREMKISRLAVAWSRSDGSCHRHGMFFILSGSKKLKNHGFVQEYVSFLLLLQTTLFFLSF